MPEFKLALRNDFLAYPQYLLCMPVSKLRNLFPMLFFE